MYRLSSLLIAVLFTLTLIACSGSETSTLAGNPGLETPAPVTAGTWPAALPVDFVQPWEKLDSSGRVASGINADSEFLCGVERTIESPGGVSDFGEAVLLESGFAGSGSLSWVMYRVLMGGEQPGVVSVDANLKVKTDGSPSSYFVGLADYGENRWDWRGPFFDSHVRVGLDAAGGGDYLSDLGNHFVCIAVFDGSVADIVGVGTNPYDGTDTEAPPVPAGLYVIPTTGGLDINWDDVIAGDLAGYRLYYGDADFTSVDEPGVRCLDYLLGQGSHLLTGLSAETYVRISAVDISGNESALSAVADATPLPGTGPELVLGISRASALINDSVALNAVGAVNYDWDIDGDGIYEVTGDTAGTQQVDTSRPGIIRPSVRGTTEDGSCVTCAAVSLIVAGNSRPVANAYAAPTTGNAPLLCSLTGAGIDDDGTLVSFSWDFDGDGAFDQTDPTDPGPVAHTYENPGLYNAKFRVEDDMGSWDIDTVTVLVYDPLLPPNQNPTASLGADPWAGDVPFECEIDAEMSTDTDGVIVRYDWDLDGDGMYEIYDGPEVINEYIFTEPGYYEIGLRVTDDRGGSDEISQTITARGWYHHTFTESDPDDKIGMLAVNNKPMIACEIDESPYQTQLFRSVDTLGTRWYDVMNPAANSKYGRVNMLMVNGRPGIFYLGDDSLGDEYIHFVRANDAFGSSWGTPVAVLDRDEYYDPNVAIVDGNPAIVCQWQDGSDRGLRFRRATDVNGDTWGATVEVVTSTNYYNLPDQGALLIADGHPAIMFMDDTSEGIQFVRATDATGSTWGAPVEIITPADPADDIYKPMPGVVDGNPAVAYEYYDNDSSTSVRESVMFCRATDAAGTTWGTPVIAAAEFDIDYAGNLAIIDGYPAFCCEGEDRDAPAYCRALDATGSTWGPVELIDEWWSMYDDITMVEVGGLPAIAYQKSIRNDNRHGLLKYAIKIE